MQFANSVFSIDFLQFCLQKENKFETVVIILSFILTNLFEQPGKVINKSS